MVHDELVMDKTTGELIPATEAIKIFYQTHGALESWLDNYELTGTEADTILTPPDFINIF